MAAIDVENGCETSRAVEVKRASGRRDIYPVRPTEAKRIGAFEIRMGVDDDRKCTAGALGGIRVRRAAGDDRVARRVEVDLEPGPPRGDLEWCSRLSPQRPERAEGPSAPQSAVGRLVNPCVLPGPARRRLAPGGEGSSANHG